MATTTDDTDRREALAAWMRANGVDPKDVTADSAFRITTGADGQRTIHYQAYERGFAPCATPCTVEPPDWLNIPTEPAALFDLPGNT